MGLVSSVGVDLASLEEVSDSVILSAGGLAQVSSIDCSAAEDAQFSEAMTLPVPPMEYELKLSVTP